MTASLTAPGDEAARRAGLPPGSRLHETRLESGLTIVAAEVSSAQLQRLVGAVDVGYLDEPDDCRGLAHLLEHALFLGSAGFPGASELAGWLGERGGRYNARTDEHMTDFHLHLPPAETDEGLARLVDLLARPRFEVESIDREVGILDAEFQARLADPALHRLMALGRLCREGHPARHCHAGNRTTLGDDPARLTTRLGDFHACHYRAGRMVLVMLGPLPLERQLDLLAGHGAALKPGGAASPQRAWRWSEPGGMAWHLPEAKAGATALELFWPLPEAIAAAHGDWLAGVAARLVDGRLAATLQAAVELDRLEATLAPEGMGPALALRLTPAPDEETIQAMLATCCTALEQAMASPLPTLPVPSLDLDAWPRQRVARPSLLKEDDRASIESPISWLTPERCRLLWQTPAAAGRWKTLAETGTCWRPQPLPRMGEPLPSRAPPALPARAPSPHTGQSKPHPLRHDERLSLWCGTPIHLADAPPASLCLGWPAPASQQPARLARWQQNTLPLRQSAAVHGMHLACAGDARGDWLVATGAAERLGSLAALAVACWPQTAPSAYGIPAKGLLAQRMLARLETLPPPTGQGPVPARLLGWASDAAGAQVAEASLMRLEERLAANPPVDEPCPPVHLDTLRLPPQGADHAVMLEISAPDDTPRSRWLLRLLAQCHDAAFNREMRQRRALGYAAAVRYRESSGFPRLGYVVQSPGTATDALQLAILDFLTDQGEALAHLASAEMAQRKHGLLVNAGHPETHAEALVRLWQALRRHPPEEGARSPWQPLPWEAEKQALLTLQPDHLSDLAANLVAGRLVRRWWLHTPGGADA
ncbi:insulinase family protein [Billgrantia sp. LNSP4103-1]|uniref:insulinase family protein n=1 Tax=Billgrantia sp. LNSP4103-1 TaxID=3410266 RepID=UPI00403F0E9B